MIPKRASAGVRVAVLASQAQVERDLARLVTDGEKLKYLDLLGDVIHAEFVRATVALQLNRAGEDEAGRG